MSGLVLLPRVRAAIALAAGTLAIAVGACGGGDGEDDDGAARPVGDGGALAHVHGLGVDPGDGALLVATHHGLFTSPPNATSVERVGDSGQDLMGFSVVENGRFLASGHPEPGDTTLPPNLGLIESTDGGETWEPVSLLGDADFHALESAGERVYGFDGTQGRLMVSHDGGREWTERAPPAPAFDLAIDPADPDHVIAATELGLIGSDDAGATWTPLSRDVAGLLARQSADRVHLVDGTGVVRTSEDGGRSWRPVGSVDGQPAAFIAHHGELYVALSDGTVRVSDDGGRSWELRAAP